MLPYLNDSGFKLINDQWDQFIEILDTKAKLADMTWQNVFGSLIFEDERKAIEKLLGDLNPTEDQTREVKVALRVNEGDIDSDMVRDYLRNAGLPGYPGTF